MDQSSRLPAGVAAIAACVWSSVARADAEVEEVIVRAPKSPGTQAPRDPSVAGQVIERDEIDKPGAQVADVLRGRPGLQVTESGGVGAPATASIRGATPAQLPVYLAGVRLNDDVAGTADLARVPLWLIDRIEIYRGNAPIEADRLGIGGALFFEPRWPSRREVAGGAVFGSFGKREAWTYGALDDQDGSVLVGLSAEGATNDYAFDNDHGTLLASTGTTTSTMSNADETTYDAWVLGRARTSGAVIDAFANGMAREQGVPTLALIPSRAARATFGRAIASARARLPLGEDTSLEAQTSLSVADSTYHDPLNELALAAHLVDLRGARLAERLAIRKAVMRSLNIHAAVDVASETLSRDDDLRIAVRARRFESRVAIAAQQWIGGSLSVQSLLAVECEGTSTTDASTCDTLQPAGRLGVAWTRPAWEAFANVGRYQRPPALGELYGMSVIVRGNPVLDAEEGVSVDAGGRWKGDRGIAHGQPPWMMVDAFVRWANDLIAFVRSSEGFTLPVNIDDARVSGVEAQAGAGLCPWLAVDATATTLDPRDTTPDRLIVNRVLPFQSRFVVAPRVSFEARTGLAWLDRVRAELRWIYQSSRYADAAGLAVIPQQSSLDAEAVAQTRDDRFTLRLHMADVLDTQRFDIVGFPLPRRAAFLALEAKW
jgi:iron complex outermembrane receptor protein